MKFKKLFLLSVLMLSSCGGRGASTINEEQATDLVANFTPVEIETIKQDTFLEIVVEEKTDTAKALMSLGNDVSLMAYYSDDLYAYVEETVKEELSVVDSHEIYSSTTKTEYSKTDESEALILVQTLEDAQSSNPVYDQQYFTREDAVEMIESDVNLMTLDSATFEEMKLSFASFTETYGSAPIYKQSGENLIIQLRLDNVEFVNSNDGGITIEDFEDGVLDLNMVIEVNNNGIVTSISADIVLTGKVNDSANGVIDVKLDLNASINTTVNGQIDREDRIPLS